MIIWNGRRKRCDPFTGFAFKIIPFFSYLKYYIIFTLFNPVQWYFYNKSSIDNLL